MTTISCTVMAGGSQADRHTINKQQYIECGLMAGGSEADAKIGSSANIIVVDSWTPAFNTKDIDHGHSVKVNLHAENTEEKEVLYDEGDDFLTTGTFDDTEVVVDALNLITAPTVDDFEGYTIGQDPIGSGWTARTTDQGWSIQQEVSGESQHLRCYQYDAESCMTNDAAGGSLTDVEMEVMIRTPETTGYTQWGLTGRITGAGSALRGYVAYVTNGWTTLNLARFTGDGTYFELDSTTITAPVANTWYHLKMHCIGDAIRAKIWKDGDAEPDWLVGEINTLYTSGAVGIWGRSNSETRKMFYDNYAIETVPPAYVSSGSWEDDIDLSAVEHYSHGFITWDETEPTNTTALVKARWRDIDSWATLTSGEEILGVDLGDDMQAGATKDTLSLRVELATTDPQATPAVENIRLYFEPVANDALLLDLAGDIDHVVADGTLDVWGKNQVSGGSALVAWDDVWIQTDGPRWAYSPGQEVAVYLEYGGVAIDDIAFGLAWDLWMESNDLTGLVWGLTPLVYDGAPAEVRWVCHEKWTPAGHVYEWVLIDKGIGIHADVWWICGHYQIDDNPGMLLAAIAETTDHFGSMLANAYRLDNFLGQALVQGYRFDNAPGMAMVAEEFLIDTVGAVLVGAEQITNTPGMVLVYGVGRDGAIFVNVIDNATYQALLDEGITFS